MNFTILTIPKIIPTSVLTGTLLNFEFNGMTDDGNPCKSKLKFRLRTCFDIVWEKTTDTTTSLNQEIQSVVIAPNPTKNETTIEYKGLVTNSNVELYDLTGRLLEAHTTTEPAGSMVLTTSNYPSGIYIVVVKSNETILSQQKLIIE